MIIGIILFKNIKYIEKDNQVIKESNYRVNLKANSFYDEEYLAKGIYPVLAIDDMVINFKYAHKNVDNYIYSIEAELIGFTNDVYESEVWHKHFIYKENIKSFKKIDDQIVIDYNYYNDLVKSYNKTYNVNIDAYLKVKMEVNYQNNNDEIVLKIPLSNSFTSILVINNDNNQPKINNYCLIGSFLFISLSLLTFLNIKLKNNDALLDLKKHFKNLFIKLNRDLNLTNYDVVFVDSLKTLISMAEVKNENILEYNNNYYLIIDQIVYNYSVINIKKL